jgi:HK97 family phage prohead protease/HK97 family phage major capsid protein
MPMKPHKGESQSDFMARCVPEMIGTGADKRPQDQAVAICMDIWRERDKRLKDLSDDAPDPDEDEMHDDFMDRCVDELQSDDEDVEDDEAEAACQISWDENVGMETDSLRTMVHKTHASAADGMDFILSDETPDRMEDVIMADGWDLENFNKNPIALFGHRSDFPIGKWKNLRVEDRQLKGHLQLAPKGTSSRIDEIRALVEADILRAVSVGFKPIESKDRDGTKWGSVFTKCELVETSLVSVPANPNALAVAKGLKISSSTLSIVFGEHASSIVQRDYRANRGEHANRKRTAEPSSKTGEHAVVKPNPAKGKQPMLLSQRIQEAEKGLIALQDQLDTHLETVDDSNPTEDQMVVTEDLTAKIELRQRNLTNLKNIEAKNASNAEDAGSTTHRKKGDLIKLPTDIVIRRAKKPEPLDYFVRSGVIAAMAKISGRSLEDTRRRIYGDDEATRVISDLMLKAASAPAETTVAGWAQELVHTIWADFMTVLLPMSVFPKLSAKGLALTFGANGKIVIPTRSLVPALSGSFVAEGAAIPVRQGAFSSQTLTPKKMAVITTWTREMDEHSIPAIEGLLREAIMQDTAIALDTVLLDANAATTIRPAGLRSYQAGLTASALAGAGSGYNNFILDYGALYGQLLTLTNGNVRSPTIICNPIQSLNLSLQQPPAAAAPLLPFIAMIDSGRLLKADLIESSTVPPGTVIMVDAADFTTAGQEGPRLEISDQATLHMEDTTPTDITGGTPSPAVPVKSMWQTDSLALRLIMFMNWIMRRPVSSWMTGVVWHS